MAQRLRLQFHDRRSSSTTEAAMPNLSDLFLKTAALAVAFVLAGVEAQTAVVIALGAGLLWQGIFSADHADDESSAAVRDL